MPASFVLPDGHVVLKDQSSQSNLPILSEKPRKRLANKPEPESSKRERKKNRETPHTTSEAHVHTFVSPVKRGRPKKVPILSPNVGAQNDNTIEQTPDLLPQPESPKRTRKRRKVLPLTSTQDTSIEINTSVTAKNVPDMKFLESKVPLMAGGNPNQVPAIQTPNISSTVHRPSTNLAISIFDNLARFPHCLLLTQVGQFYESYFDQAEEVSRLLSIKLTSRGWGGQRVAMCGFPLTHLDRHLKRLVQRHKRSVAMCEEFKNQDGSGFSRRVTRILTPGTLIDETFLNQYDNNYLMAISLLGDGSIQSSHQPLGTSWIDVSTGEFFFQQTTVSNIQDDLARIGPREVVLDKSLENTPEHPIRLALAEEDLFISYIAPDTISSPRFSELVPNPDDITAHQPLPSPYTEVESSAISLLSHFLRSNLMDYMPTLPSPLRQSTNSRMQIDAHTIRALEIRESIREGGTAGSLLSVIKRTVTNSGTRLLARWICSPSTSIPEINARQSLVALFHSRPHLRQDLMALLRRIEDTARIVQKFLVGKGDPTDLSAIKDTIEVSHLIKSRIELERSMGLSDQPQECWALDILLGKMADLRPLAERIGLAVDETELRKREPTPSAALAPGEESSGIDSTEESSPKCSPWRIKPQFSPELGALHSQLTQLWSEKVALELKLQKRLAAPSLSLRSSPRYGIHVHIGRAGRDLATIGKISSYIPLAQTGSTKLFFNQAWFSLGNSIAETETAIYHLERTAFESLRSKVNAQAGSLRRNARIIDELDVTIAFSKLSTEMKFVRPMLTEESLYHVVNGRHPTVELGLLASGRLFIPNTISLSPSSRLQIITGPNMAGKSTLLRQTALISILAQSGSFVPADYAELGIVDKVFSRVGARDDLFRDKSTFMVEMLETAEILRRATERSLVIMDEVGRGTTVKDGIAIAFATIQHLYIANRCRGLFATHFHELVDMLGYSEATMKGDGAFRNIGFFCTDVNETEEGSFSYSHKLRPGVNRNSHGLKVARMAGMPDSLIRIAAQIMRSMEGVSMSASELKDLCSNLAITETPENGDV